MTRNPELPDRWESSGYSHSMGQPLPIETSSSGSFSLPQKRSVSSSTPSRIPQQPTQEQPLRKRRLRLPTSWQFWALVIVIVSGTLGFTAVGLLLKMPSRPNCPSIFWPTASASLRIYCAQVAASKQTPEDLLKAIALVSSLPDDHPLRPEINRNIEEWSRDLLRLAENLYQEGKLSEAIALVRQLPKNSPASKDIEKRISAWQSVWSKAEKIEAEVEQLLRKSHWTQAFTTAVELTKLGNQYLETTKFEEVVNKINQAREESAQLNEARRLMRRGGIKNLLAAIKIAEQFDSKSYAYKEAQDLLKNIGEQLLKVARERLRQRNWQGVLEITNQIPATLKLDGEVQNIADLARANSAAEKGTISSLEDAIAFAQKIKPESSFHSQAQDSIVRWQREIEDVAHLQRARDLASGGNVANLRAGILEAQKIPSVNPRRAEASQEILKWTRQIETIEDQPFLNRASELAVVATVPSLQNAIAEARQVRQGRVLYQEAQNKIRQWNEQIQRIEDRPILDRALMQANMGNLSGAVAIAQSIRPGRVLYQDAQNQIGQWSDRVQRLEDGPFINQAEIQAVSGNLPGAIATAQNVRSGRALHGEAQSKIQQWNRQIEQAEDRPFLDRAEALAFAGDINAAIVNAQQIRPGRSLYSEAQGRIRTWEQDRRAQEDIQSAQQLATPGTPEALAAAIRAARQVPASSRWRSDARAAMNNWSNQLYAIAQARSMSDPQAAISIANNIPAGTDIYSSAQAQIRTWQNRLNPPILTLESN